MSQSNNEMSSFLAELAGEATQTLEAKRSQQQDRHEIEQSVHSALDRAFQFFNVLVKHLNALEPSIERTYAFDGKAHFAPLRWKNGLIEYRKQSLADNALFDHVYFQVKMLVPEPVQVTRRWEQFDEVRKDVLAFGVKPKEDLHELWRNRTQKPTFQITLEPEFLIRMRFQANYTEGCVDLECGNLDGFGEIKAKLRPEQLTTSVFDEFGRYLMGRSKYLPSEIKFTRDLSRNM